MATDKLHVRRLARGEAHLFRSIRLRALQQDPQAFGSTYASALQRSPESWIEQADASASGPDRATFVAIDSQETVGITALYRDPSRASTGELIQVWVAPEHRGAGLARWLLRSTLDWARESGIEHVLAEVMTDNEGALRFYAGEGFIVEREVPALEEGPKDSVILRLDISA